MNLNTSELSPCIDADHLLPRTVHLTSATIRAWRNAGYHVSEERVAQWLYLRARSSRDSAVYKVVGPSFRGPSASYLGIRVA